MQQESTTYQVAFGNHLRALIKVTNGTIEIENAVNGWGDPVQSTEIKIEIVEDFI